MKQIHSFTNRIKTLALITSSMLMVTTLSACQSVANKTEQTQARDQHSMRHYAEMTEEQKQQLQLKRQQWAQQRIEVCDGKAVGDQVQIQRGHKLKTGQCQVMFHLDDKSQSTLRQSYKSTQAMTRQDMKALTAEQRDQIRQRREAKRAEYQALHQQFQTACQGQSVGKTVNIQLGQQNVSGQCVLQYQANQANTLQQS